MLVFLLVVAMLSRVHRVYVRLVCRSDGFWDNVWWVAMAFKSGPVFGPVFWPQICAQKSEARLSGFIFLEPHRRPYFGPKNETTTVVPGALCGSAIVKFVSIHVDAQPVSVHCTIFNVFVHLYGNLMRLARNLAFCVCEWSGGTRGYFLFWGQAAAEVVPGAAVLVKYGAFGGWCVLGP